jgi:hypothetical protein
MINEQIIKMLYPLCCTETKILIDQLRKNPEKFLSSPSNQLAMTSNPWKSIMAYGKFSWYERIAVKLELRLQHIAYTRSDILAALLDPTTRNPYDIYTATVPNIAPQNGRTSVKVIPRTPPFAPNPAMGAPYTSNTTTGVPPNPYATSTISGSTTK